MAETEDSTRSLREYLAPRVYGWLRLYAPAQLKTDAPEWKSLTDHERYLWGECTRGILAIISARIEDGLLAGVEQAVEHGSGEAQHAVEAYRQVIDLLDGDG